MRNFLKQNFLFVLGLFFGYAALEMSFGSTFVRPYGTPDYAGGQKAVGAKVNAEFQALSDFLNGGNIGSTNIATGGVATANLAANSVTVAKMLTENLLVTASSSAFSITTAGGAPVTVTNLSTTITTTGRSVYVGLEPAPATYLLSNIQTFGSYVMAITSTAAVNEDVLFFVKDGSTTAHFDIAGENSNTEKIQLPCSSFHYIDAASLGNAGTYTYAVKVSQRQDADAVRVFNCRLVVRELY